MLIYNDQKDYTIKRNEENYGMFIPEDNFWRRLNNVVDFSLVYESLKDKYRTTLGKSYEDVIRMFKYILLKSYYKLSDKQLIEKSNTDLVFRYFLNYEPMEPITISEQLIKNFRHESLVEEVDNLREVLSKIVDDLRLKENLIKSEINELTGNFTVYLKEEIIYQIRILNPKDSILDKIKDVRMDSLVDIIDYSKLLQEDNEMSVSYLRELLDDLNFYAENYLSNTIYETVVIFLNDMKEIVQ